MKTLKKLETKVNEGAFYANKCLINDLSFSDKVYHQQNVFKGEFIATLQDEWGINEAQATLLYNEFNFMPNDELIEKMNEISNFLLPLLQLQSEPVN